MGQISEIHSLIQLQLQNFICCTNDCFEWNFEPRVVNQKTFKDLHQKMDRKI